MLARFRLLLPFRLTIPDNEPFALVSYEDQGYGVTVLPPGRSGRGGGVAGPEDVLRVDGRPALEADVLQIEFRKVTFDRTEDGPCDPPEAVISQAINAFLSRMRYVLRVADIRPLTYPWGSWQLHYLNDDETEFEAVEGLCRVRLGLAFNVRITALTTQVWDHVHRELSPDFQPPPWEDLLIDAWADLPRVGPAVVLAATALEVFISSTLNRLAETSAVSPSLWSWITDRGDHLREPTVEEQYDVLLKLFVGHSLKEDPKLWEGFKNLKSARNAFVHEGTARISKASPPLSAATAGELVTIAIEVVRAVREWLPLELQWRVFNPTIRIEFSMRLPGAFRRPDQ